MMSRYVLIDGDQAHFIRSFGAAMVEVRPGTLTASGPTTLHSSKLCVAGDEKTVVVPGCVYTTPSYPIPGTGTLEIASLAGDQTAQKTRSGAKPVLLVGSSFTARFMVQTPAMVQRPVPPPTLYVLEPDATPQYSGTGMFITTNTKLTGA
jgi:hypothetical protein